MYMKKIFTIVVLMVASVVCINAQNDVDGVYFSPSVSHNASNEIKGKTNREIYEAYQLCINKLDELSIKHKMLLKNYVDTVKLARKGDGVSGYGYNSDKYDNLILFNGDLKKGINKTIIEFHNYCINKYGEKKVEKAFFTLNIELYLLSTGYKRDIWHYASQLFDDKRMKYEHTSEELEQMKIDEEKERKKNLRRLAIINAMRR